MNDDPPMSPASSILRGDCLAVLPRLPASFARLIYIDPPFNTGQTQQRTRIRATADQNGDRSGFGGRRYRTERRDAESTYPDSFDDYVAFLMPRIESGPRCLMTDGRLFVPLASRAAPQGNGPR